MDNSANFIKEVYNVSKDIGKKVMKMTSIAVGLGEYVTDDNESKNDKKQVGKTDEVKHTCPTR